MRTLEKRERLAVGFAVIATIILFFGGNLWSLFTGAKAGSNPENTPAQPSSPILPTTTPGTTMNNISKTAGLEIYDEVVGTGTVAEIGKKITVHYVGIFKDGTKFDSSVDRGQPFEFELGAGQVIAGWDKGFEGMKVGGTRKLVVSPELGYGPNDYHSIPGGSTLIFQVQLLGVK